MAKTKSDPPSTDTIPVMDIKDLLGTPVEPAAKPAVIDPEEPQFFDNTVIDDAPEPQPQPAPGAQSQPGYAAPSLPYNGPQEPVMLSPDDMAIIGVNCFDGIQQFLLTLLSKKLMLTAEESELLERLDRTSKSFYEVGTKEALVMQKWQKHIENITGLPFNEGEKDRLTKAAIIYMRTLNFQATPFGGLLAALSEVMVTRGSSIVMSTL